MPYRGIASLAHFVGRDYIRMTSMTDTLVHRAPVLLLIASAVLLAAAFGAQHLGGLDPCILCIYQRWPYVAVIVLAALALAVHRIERLRVALVWGSGVALFVGAGIAGYHVGVEQGWWPGTDACIGIVPVAGGSAPDLAAQLLATPPARCDVVPWSLFGISIAGYNFLATTLLGLASFYAAARMTKEHSR